MRENFEKAMPFIFFWEGYMSNNPSDPGGLTIWGIAEKYHPDQVEKMIGVSYTESQKLAREFYLDRYWTPAKCDNLPDLIDIVIFDSAINQGVSAAMRIAEKAIDWRDAIILRLDRYDSSRGSKMFLRGWSKRLVSLRDYIASDFRIIHWD